jgi:hypothetical protein
MILVILFILFGAATAVASDLSVTGYYKNFFVAYDAPSVETNLSIPDTPLLGSVTNRIRLNAFYNPNNWLSISLSYNILPRIQDPSLFEAPPNITWTGFPSYRFADLESRIYPDDDEDLNSFGLFQNLDRAMVTITTPFADIYAGRQAIAWGSGHAVNPTDVLAPFSFDELDTEDRLGVDAVRVRAPLGVMGEFDAGYVFGDDFEFEESAFFFRGKVYHFKTDISMMLVGFRENMMLGWDLTRSIGGAGAWLEAAYVFDNALGEESDRPKEDYFRASIGANYALTDKLYGFLEYHLSGAGTGNPNRYVDQLIRTPYTDGTVYLLGKHYVIPGFSYQITPLLFFGGQLLTNLQDPSLLFAPNLEYNIAENIYLAGGAFIGFGERSQVLIKEYQGMTIRYRSEFGIYSDLYFTSFRVYF